MPLAGKVRWSHQNETGLKGRKRPYTLQVICELSVKGRKRHKMRSFTKIKQSCRTVFTKQPSLVSFAVMSIIMNYLPKNNGKDNCLKSRFCLSCKNDEISLRPFWHNTVDIFRTWRHSESGIVTCTLIFFKFQMLTLTHPGHGTHSTCKCVHSCTTEGDHRTEQCRPSVA